MPEGPPLLKERRYLRKDAAEHLWKSLQTQGWKKTRPLWERLLNPEPVFVALLVSQEAGQVMRMCCNDPNAPHHKNEEQPKETSQKSSPEQPTLFRGALWMPVSKSKV